MEDTKKIRKRIFTFLIITFALSSIFYFLIISTGKLRAGWGLYVLGLMWCPGIAALLTQFLHKRSFSDLGWDWGKTRYQLMSYATPFFYALVAYSLVWTTGLGGFFNEDFVSKVAKNFGWETLPSYVAILLFVLFSGIFGFVRSCSSALGEEIGWRGFLVPNLVKVTSFSNTALISGIVWAAWHYPILLFADYNSGTPAWYGLTCFTVLVVSISFVFAWLRLRSGSLWTGVFLHASHNLFIQSVFTPLTTDTGKTKYIIGEFGAALAIVSVLVAFIFWNMRSELPDAEGRAATTDELSEAAA